MNKDEVNQMRVTAAEAASSILLQEYHGQFRPVRREDFAEVGYWLWERSYKHRTHIPEGPNDDFEAYQRLAEALHRESENMSIALHTPNHQIQMLWAARWVDQGLPQITMGHKYCAALLATSVPGDAVQDVAPPWKAFLIVLPTNLLHIKDPKGAEVPLQYLLAQHMMTERGPSWNYMAVTDSALSLWVHNASVEDLVRADLRSIWDGASFVIPQEKQDERVRILLGRLLINVCLAMSNPDNFKAPKPSKPGTKKHERKEAPDIRTFQLGAPIEIDCREAIRAYVAGTAGATRSTTAPSVQSLVRGHWKRQVRGAGRTERVWIQVRPYWRGPDGAPILVRPHAFKDESSCPPSIMKD